MKRLSNGQLQEIKVQITLEECQIPIVGKSEIRPVYPDFLTNNQVDEQALADYNCFIEDTIAELENLDLEIYAKNSSKRSYTSKYFTIVDLEQHVKHTLKYMIFLRISDHLSADFGDYQRSINTGIRKHRDSIQDEISKEQGHRVVWKVREIIVNSQRFDNYDEAVDYIRELAEGWVKMLKSPSK